MCLARRQCTLADSASVSGFGFWSGRDVRLEFRPAPASSGIVFVRTDLPGRPVIPADVRRRIDAPRRTILSQGGVRVEMVEHVMAALAGLCVDNCEVWVDAAEMPGCDGSSLPFVEAIRQAGVVQLEAYVEPLVIKRPVRIAGADKWIEGAPATAGLTIAYELDYGGKSPIGRQSMVFDVGPETFCHELAASRTFLLKAEAEALAAGGLGKRVSPRDLLIFDEEGPIENELRFGDECVRHKILDVVGDLALAGRPVIGHITAHRSGHQLNAELVSALLSQAAELSPAARCA